MQREKSNFSVEKPGKHLFSQVIKMNITSNGTHQHWERPDVMEQKGHEVTSVLFLLKMHTMNFNVTPDKSKFRDIPQNNWPVFLKGSNHKRKEDEELS